MLLKLAQSNMKMASMKIPNFRNLSAARNLFFIHRGWQTIHPNATMIGIDHGKKDSVSHTVVALRREASANGSVSHALSNSI